MSGPPPLRVEKALAILADLEVLAPLRGLILSLAHTDEDQVWSSSGPYLTVGKRGLDAEELRSRLPGLLELVGAHMRALYEAAADAIGALQRSDPESAVAALLLAGEREEAAGRLAQAQAWYEAAAPLAAGLSVRRPEIECLRRLGEVCRRLRRYTDGARHYQRSLALAEAEFDQASAVAAGLGLGDIARARGEWLGANAWYQRAYRLAEAAGDTIALGRVERRLGILAYRKGDLNAAAAHLQRAREYLEKVGDAAELSGALTSHGLVEAALGRRTAALAAYREALAWLRRAPVDPAREIDIRLRLAELGIEGDRLLDAEEELRRAEQIAVAGNVAACLIRVYAQMGRLRGLQNDETGFVFFEQALVLCRTLGHPPSDEARLFHEYGMFRNRLGDAEEARVYLERARALFDALGEGAELARVEEELKRTTA